MILSELFNFYFIFGFLICLFLREFVVFSEEIDDGFCLYFCVSLKLIKCY